MAAKKKTVSKAAARRKRKALQKKGKAGIVIRRPGRFTAWCKRQGFGSVTAACISKGLKSRDPAVRKMANFARNARRFKKTRRK